MKQEIDIDDDNRDDREDEEEEEAYLKTKQNVLKTTDFKEKNQCFMDSASRSSAGEDIIEPENEIENLSTKHSRRMSKSLTNNYFRRHSKNFNYSPDTTDYDSNYGDFDFENESPMRYLNSDFAHTQQFNTTATATIPSATVDLSGGPINNYARYCTSMPVLEDGLSSGHASDSENNNQITLPLDKNSLNQRNAALSSISTFQKQYQENLVQNKSNNLININVNTFYSNNNNNYSATMEQSALINNDDNDFKINSAQSPPNYHSFYPIKIENKDFNSSANNVSNNLIYKNRDTESEAFYTISKLSLYF